MAMLWLIKVAARLQLPAGLLKITILIVQQNILGPSNRHCTGNIENFSSQLGYIHQH
jgi:hypothetical protein